MSKIELSLTADELVYLSNKTLLVQTIRFNELDRKTKIAHSILLELSDKLELKSKKLTRTPDIFNSKKKHKITIKYHEAAFLENYLDGFQTQEQGYNANMLLKITTLLNKKIV